MFRIRFSLFKNFQIISRPRRLINMVEVEKFAASDVLLDLSNYRNIKNLNLPRALVSTEVVSLFVALIANQRP